MNNLTSDSPNNDQEKTVQVTPLSKIHPLVLYVISADIFSMMLAIFGLFIPIINKIGAAFLCGNGTITVTPSDSLISNISCVQNGATEEITYLAMAFTFVFFSLIMSVTSSIYYVTTQSKKS
jgi:hypothetical protein